MERQVVTPNVLLELPKRTPILVEGRRDDGVRSKARGLQTRQTTIVRLDGARI